MSDHIFPDSSEHDMLILVNPHTSLSSETLVIYPAKNKTPYQ